jgi:3-deoxy-manno-octulosonate cytidylyltransferase (CMP-KDO synthetase)
LGNYRKIFGREVNRMIETLAVIPARYGSTRLPGKPLRKFRDEDRDKELILWVWEGVKQSKLVDRLVVVADSEKVAELTRKAGGEVKVIENFEKKFSTGSDCVAAIANEIPSRFVLGVQVDDPMVSPQMIDPMIEALKNDPDIKLAVLVKRIEHACEIKSRSIVKVVFDESRRALYFSRLPLPFEKEAPAVPRYKHIGPYAWRRGVLLEHYGTGKARTALEKSESLEMLRVLEKGGTIHCLDTDMDTIEIDVPEDAALFDRFVATDSRSQSDLYQIKKQGYAALKELKL